MSMEHRKTITSILDEFFEPALRPINVIAESLVAKNAAVSQHTSKGGGSYNPAVFTFRNKVFPHYKGRNVYHGKPLQLAPILVPEFEPAYRDFRRIVDVMTDLYQLLAQTTQGSADRQEFRDAVPDCIAMVTSLRHTPRRTQDPLYHCRSNAFAVAAYHRLLPKAEEYAAYHFIL
jgi:hypothetical protein